MCRFPCLFLLFDPELFLFPAVFGGFLLGRLVGQDLLGDRDGLGLAQRLQGLVLLLTQAGGRLGRRERRPTDADTKRQNTQIATQIAVPHADLLMETSV
jgi:hypothetical protein